MWWHPWIYSRHLPFIHAPAEVKNNLPEETRARLDFGNNLHSGRLEDRGLEEVMHSDERLRLGSLGFRRVITIPPRVIG